jgi:hypothetical protein
MDDPLIYYRRHARQQIGFPSTTWQGLLQLVRAQTAAACRQEAESLERLCTRLLALGVDPELSAIETLRRKGRLLAQRAEMRSHRSRAPLLIWRALREGAYRGFPIGRMQLEVDVLAFGMSAGSGADVARPRDSTHPPSNPNR